MVCHLWGGKPRRKRTRSCCAVPVVAELHRVLLGFGACWWCLVWDVVLGCYGTEKIIKKKKRLVLGSSSKIGKLIPKRLPKLLLRLQGTKPASFVCQRSHDDDAAAASVKLCQAPSAVVFEVPGAGVTVCSTSISWQPTVLPSFGCALRSKGSSLPGRCLPGPAVKRYQLLIR